MTDWKNRITQVGILGCRTLAPTMFLTGLAVVFTWPLVLHLDTMIPGPVGDNYYYVWLIGWFQKSLLTLHLNPFSVPILNYPDGWSLAYTETTISNVALALPLSVVWGPVVAYNLVILASFVLSGLIVRRWVLETTGNGLAGFVAGTLFAFAPYRLAHLEAHLPLLGTQWLALHFYGLHRLLRQPSFSWKWSAVAAAGYGLAALSSAYYLYMTPVVSAVFVICHLLIAPPISVRRGFVWANLVTTTLVCAVLGLASALPFLTLAQEDPSHRSFEEVDFWSASPTDFVAPSPQHSLWGEWAWTTFHGAQWPEREIYVGAVTLVLCGVALFTSRKEPGKLSTAVVLMVSAIGAAILALGLTLYWMGNPVLFKPVPWLQGWWLTAKGAVPLPGYLLFRFLPFYDGMRVLARYGVFTSLFAAVCAGMGMAWLSRRWSSRRAQVLLFTLTTAAIVLDYHSDLPFSKIEPHPVDRWLATQELRGAVIEFPVDEVHEPLVVYGTLIHGKPTIDTFYGAYYPRTFEEILPTLRAFPSEKSLELLRERGAELVILDGSRLPELPAVENRVRQLGLEFVVSLEGKSIYRIPDFPSPDPAGQAPSCDCP